MGRRRMARRWWFAIAGAVLALAQIVWAVSTWWNDVPADFEPGEACSVAGAGYIRTVGSGLQFTCVYQSGSIEYVSRAVLAAIGALGFAGVASFLVFAILSRPYSRYIVSVMMAGLVAIGGVFVSVPLVTNVFGPVAGPGPTAIAALKTPMQKLVDDSLAAAGASSSARLTVGLCPDAAPGKTWNYRATISSTLDRDAVVSAVGQVWITRGYEFDDTATSDFYTATSTSSPIATDLRITRTGDSYLLELRSACAVGWVGDGAR